jgi:hypothetical protein
MRDTTPEIKSRIDDIYRKMSGEQKLLISLKMFETVREIVLSSLPENLSDKELSRELFLRFYRTDFDESEIEKIINSF